MANHPNKHIRKSIQYSESLGWRVTKAGGQAHIWGKLLCPANRRGGCIIKVYSTPRNPENHAKTIRLAIDDCPH